MFTWHGVEDISVVKRISWFFISVAAAVVCFFLTSTEACFAREECLSHRSNLTGDWLGQRTRLAESGITFQGDVTQYYQGVAHGGLNQRFRYGGHSDYIFDFDMDNLLAVKDFLSGCAVSRNSVSS